MRSTLPSRLVLALSAAALASGCLSSTKESAPAGPTMPIDAMPFASEVGQGVSYLRERSDDLLSAVENLIAAIEIGDLASCKNAYFEARAPYEEIEVLARAFPDLHRSIDARAYEFETGELDPDFRGFHRIEIFLFAREKPALALQYAQQLLTDVQALRTALDDRTRYTAPMAFDAMIGRCMEIATKTVSSEEEMWSDQSLIVVRHAWIGIHSQYRFYGGKVRAKDVKLAERLDRSYRKAVELIAAEFPLGQTQGSPFSIIDRVQRRQIADASLKLRRYLIQAQETLDLVDV
ncbi:MAG: EfeM/EfeO family lipoprotein [Planctomycetota bacterium]